MNNFFVSSFEKHQRIDGKESRIKGMNQNGHVTMEGVIEGKKFVYDNEPSHKVFRKTPYPSSLLLEKSKKRRRRRGRRGNKSRKRKRGTTIQ